MLTGCATKPIVRTDFCRGWKPIYVHEGDVLTDRTAREILAYNKTGVALGCWQVPK